MPDCCRIVARGTCRAPPALNHVHHLQHPGPLFESGGSLTSIRRCGSRLGGTTVSIVYSLLISWYNTGRLLACFGPLSYTLGRSRRAAGAEAGLIQTPAGGFRGLGIAEKSARSRKSLVSACLCSVNCSSICRRFRCSKGQRGGVVVAKHRTHREGRSCGPPLGALSWRLYRCR